MLKVISSLVVAAVLGLPAPGRAQPSGDVLAQAGWQALQGGDADKAAVIFRDELTIHPRNAVLNLGAGIAAHMQGRDHEAMAFLQTALNADPRLAPAAILLGAIAHAEGDLDLAIKTYERALTHIPGDQSLRQQLEVWRREAAVHEGAIALKDDRFAIMFNGPVQEQIAARAISVLGGSFWRIGNTLGSYPSAPITVILYSDQQFHDITGAPEWAAGGFDGQIRLPVQGALRSPRELDRVLTHELTHAMLKSLAPRNLPAWLNEGLAMYFEGHDSALAARRLSSVRLFVPLAALETSFVRLNATQAAVAYEESSFAAQALVDRIGPEGIALLLQDLGAGQTMGQAVQRFGFSLTEFETTLAHRVGVAR